MTLCEIANDCLFYQKNTYTKSETEFYSDYCLKAGIGCGLKKNHDVSERIKRMQTKDFPRDKKTWRSN